MSDIGHTRIAIIGSGFAGIGMGIRLKQEGVDDFVILERAGDLGGTWRDNTYPGCRCDVPSHLYSFSFEPNPAWSSTFSPQSEIWDYLRRCSDKYGVTPHIRYEHELLDAGWNEGSGVWEIATAKGSLTADILVSGSGGLSDPKLPDLPGLDSFEGTHFHSARWDHQHDLSGARVAVIGTGASAIQFVPEIQPKVDKVLVFQRSAPWIVPRRDRPLTRVERLVYRAVPPLQLAMRASIYWARELIVLGFRRRRVGKLNELVARKHLESQVSDPGLREKLTPSYRMGCKRVLISNDYYPALQQPNAELVTDAIHEVKPHAIVTADGTEHEVDTIVFGTGFSVTDLPVAHRVRGKEGITLADTWQGSMQAFRGTTVAGFPNLFFLVGPNTGLGHTSIIFMIESQVNYVMDAIKTMEARGVAAVEVRKEAQDAFNDDVQEDMKGTVWTSGGCLSWYLDAKGKNTVLWPGFTWSFREITRRFDPAHYELRAREVEREPLAA